MRNDRDCKPVEGLDIFEKLSYIYIHPLVIFGIELQLVGLRGTREIYKIGQYRVKEC